MSSKSIIIREKDGMYLTCFNGEGEVHWFRQEIKIPNDSYTSPALVSNKKKSFKPLIFWIILLVPTILIFAFTSTAISTFDTLAIIYAYLINFITFSSLIIGIVAGYSNKIHDDPVLTKNKSVELISKSRHIISILKNIDEPGYINGLYSIPRSYILGYRFKTKSKQVKTENRGKEYYPEAYALSLVLKNRIVLDITAGHSVPVGNYDKLSETVEKSLITLGIDPKRKLDEGRWIIRGVPDDIPTNQAITIHKTRDKNIQQIIQRKPVEAHLPFNFRLLLPCSVCKRDLLPGNLILRPVKERYDPLICYSCLKSQLKSRYKKHNDQLDLTRSFVSGLINIRDSLKRMKEKLSGDDAAGTLGTVFTVVVVFAILLLFALVLILLLILTLLLAEIFIFASVRWLGYLLVEKPFDRDLKKIVSLDSGLSKQSQKFLEEEFNLKMTLTNVEKQTWLGMIVISLFLALIELFFMIWVRYHLFLTMLTETTVFSVLILVLYFCIPLIIITAGLTLAIMTIGADSHQLYYFNYYIPSRIKFNQ
ncbi:MAG: hypothetical protein ACXAEU_10640 [Candidatus Hodarchaeales archaeon]|jgi:hypothetical protein